MVDGKSAVTARLDSEQVRVLDEIAMVGNRGRAEVIRDLVDRYAAALKIEDVKELPLDGQHYAVVSPTFHGKTSLARHYLIPKLSGKYRVLVIDPHFEYTEGYEVIPVDYDKAIPPSDNQLFQLFALQSTWADVDRIATQTLEAVRKSKARRIAMQLNIVDPEADKMFVGMLLKRMTQLRWDRILVVVEEANKYDCLSVVARGRHAGIKAILISQYPLSEETMSNVNVILGPINPKLAETIDPSVTFALLELKQGEFIFEVRKGRWARFRHVLKKTGGGN